MEISNLCCASPAVPAVTKMMPWLSVYLLLLGSVTIGYVGLSLLYDSGKDLWKIMLEKGSTYKI